MSRLLLHVLSVQKLSLLRDPSLPLFINFSLPTVNQGELAIICRWFFLYLSSQGPSAFALDNILGLRRWPRVASIAARSREACSRSGTSQSPCAGRAREAHRVGG